MKVTPALLLELGAKHKRDGIYELKMHGHSFCFAFHVDALVNNGEPTVRLFVDDRSASGPNFHCVTDLEECFGFIADHFYCDGKKAAKQELRDWLETN